MAMCCQCSEQFGEKHLPPALLFMSQNDQISKNINTPTVYQECHHYNMPTRFQLQFILQHLIAKSPTF